MGAVRAVWVARVVRVAPRPSAPGGLSPLPSMALKAAMSTRALITSRTGSCTGMDSRADAARRAAASLSVK